MRCVWAIHRTDMMRHASYLGDTSNCQAEKRVVFGLDTYFSLWNSVVEEVELGVFKHNRCANIVISAILRCLYGFLVAVQYTCTTAWRYNLPGGA
jgi:hypothetical protein